MRYAKKWNHWLERPIDVKSFGIVFLNQRYHSCYCWTCGYDFNSIDATVGFWRPWREINGYSIGEYICIPCFASKKGTERGWIK